MCRMPSAAMMAALLPCFAASAQNAPQSASVPSATLAAATPGYATVLPGAPPADQQPAIVAPQSAQLGFTTPVMPQAQNRQPPQRIAAQALVLEAGAGRVVSLTVPAASVFTADPRVAEVRPASPTSLFVFGVAPGRTTVAAMDAAGAPLMQFEVTIRPSSYAATEAQATLQRILPGRAIRVETRANGLAVHGEVRSAAEADQIVTVLRGHLAEGQQIDNRLTVGGATQVNLRVRVAEVSRQVTRQLGINWQALGSIGRFAVNLRTLNSLADAVNQSSQATLGYRGAVDVNSVIDALAQDQLIRILAEPNLTAQSGETASFLVGGEFPIPVSQINNQVTIQFKQFGISLAFVPTVLGDGRVSMRVRPEVSELSDNGAVRLAAGNSTLQIPALSVRRAETTVELGSGQSFAIAGLLQDTSTTTGRALPQVGEVPIIGSLFRSDRFQRQETELVIVVTPYIVRPVSDSNAINTPVDGHVPAGDADRILRMRQTARPPRGPRSNLPGDAGFSVN